MKKIYLFLLILLITGCGTKASNKFEFKENDIICNDYVLRLENISEFSTGDYTLYKVDENLNYTKVGNIIDGDFSGKIIENSTSLIFIDKLVPYISIYNKNTLENNTKIGLKDIGTLREVLGIKEDNLYISHDSDYETKYIKFNIETNVIENINLTDLPNSYDYKICN